MMENPLRVVSIGGGTGLSALLNGLKRYTSPTGQDAQVDITAIVTVTDDGGSSGRLRRDFDVLPPGDIRNCMAALAEDGTLLAKLFQYRFQSGHGLKGHSFGNLFLTALTDITGDFPDAVQRSSEVLNIAGKIYPSTSANVSLEAILENGKVVCGETKISSSRKRIKEIRLNPRHVKPLKATLEAIANADLITLGPGSLFTSVIPNLLVDGIPKAIRNSKAIKAYFVNLMWQPGETTDFRASDHIQAIEDHAGGPIVEYAVVNTSPISRAVRKRYALENAQPVENDIDAIQAKGIFVRQAAVLQKGPNVRHNPEAIARAALELAVEGRLRRTGYALCETVD